MNRHLFRLVFNRCRGLCVPAAECCRAAGKPASGSAPAAPGRLPAAAGLGLGTLGLGLLLGAAADAATPIPRAATLAPRVASLPVRSTSTERTAGDFGQFSTSTAVANRLVVNQTSARAIINWDSFDVAKGSTVQFVQPDKGSALNRIWDANPSLIQGSIVANGEVILQNSNGVIFAPTARVDTGRFVATALQVAEDAFKKSLRGVIDGSASFANADGQTQGFVSLERGAEIKVAAGGDVLIFAPRVLNEGRIETPGGQAVLGAGQTVYLAASADPTQRGLVIGIRPFASSDTDLNTVTQAEARSYKTVDGQTVADSTPDGTAGLVSKVNAIVAERGAINLVGLALRQNGLLQATTAVKGENGVIMLQAQADVVQVAIPQIAGAFQSAASALGSVTLGPTSVTQVQPVADPSATQYDSETFNASHIRVEGRQVRVQGGAQVLAPAGHIELLASARPDKSNVFNPGSNDLVSHAGDPSRIVVESGALISAAGLRDVALPMSRNQMSGRLFQIELADSPVQRDGVLYREEVFFDARSTPAIANVSGFYSTVARTAEERSITGGTVSLRADGGLAVDGGARIDVSGGSVRFGDGEIRTSLLRQGSTWVAFDKASADQRYDELGNAKARTDLGQALFRVDAVQGYVQGSSAGTVTLDGRRMYLGGSIDGSVVTGPRQTGRGPDAAPLAGALVIGEQGRVLDSLLPSVRVQAGAVGGRPDALFADPLTASVDDNLPSTLLLSSEVLNSSGLGSLSFGLGDSFTLASGAALLLGNGGQLRVTAGSIHLDGRLQAPSGTVALTSSLDRGPAGSAHDIALGGGALLDVAGTWTDDSNTAAASGTVSLAGGQVSLASVGGLSADQGARIDVSAGARRVGSSLSTGKAGSLSLGLNNGAVFTDQPASALPAGYSGRTLAELSTLDDWHAALAGFDFSSGGKLGVAGLPGLSLGGGTGSLFDADFFNGHGFGSISLASLGAVSVARGFQLDLQLANYLPDLSAGSALNDGRLASVGVKPVASQRAAVSLTLRASNAPALAGSDPGVDPGQLGGILTMASGARISTEAGGSLTLEAQRRLQVAGELAAPGGSITLRLGGVRGGGEPTTDSFDDKLGFLADQALWLAPTATLSVAGTTELQADALGRPVGTVYGGGTITLNASRGYVVAEEGAGLDLRGAAASVMTSAAATPQTVSRSAGSLVISTPEGLHLAAAVQATAADANADGGVLSVALGLGGRDTLSAGDASRPGAAIPLPTTARELHLTDTLDSLSAGRFGDSVQSWLGNGVGSLSSEALREAGFSQLRLQADDRIRLDANLTLAAARSISLDSRVLAGAAGTEAAVRAPYVALGDQRRTAPLWDGSGQLKATDTAPQSSAGDAQLDVRAGLIDVYGQSALQGFSFVGLNATLDAAGGNTRQDGEVRLVGTVRGAAAQPVGALQFSGELQVMAGQLYTTTLSQFTLNGNGESSYFGSYQPAGLSNSAAPLSALGSLAISAGRIDVAGVIRQPFGSLSLTASGQLNLLAGSEVSVAGSGNSVPVGTTVNGQQWQYRADGLYATDGTAKSVDATDNPDILALDSLPTAKALTLAAAALSVADGAAVSAAGGGTLQAWEFVQGVGGSTDALARAGYFAVLPSRSYGFAPSDAEVLASAGAAAPQVGAQIDISLAGSALAPGRYTLLPARYALLPGAVLVSLAPDQGKSALGSALHNDDGSTVVTGAFTAVGSRLQQPQRVLVAPAATVLARSRLDVTDVGDLLAGQAQRLDRATPLLPSDAGRVSLSSAQALRLNTAIDLRGADGAAGGSLDIAVTDGMIAVVDQVASPPPSLGAGWSLLGAAALSDSGAGSLLLGGLRGSDGLDIDVESRAVQMLATQPRGNSGQLPALQAGEILLAALDDVTVAAGASLVASSSTAIADRTFRLAGDSAFALVSNAAGSELVRQDAGSASAHHRGVLTLAAGARLAGASVLLDAARSVDVSADAVLQADHLGLAAQRLALGTPGQAEAGVTVLQGRVLADAAATASLSLRSRSSIDFWGDLDLSLASLSLDAPKLRGRSGASQAVRLQAQTLTLGNSSGLAADATLAGGGALTLQTVSNPGDGRAGRLVVGASATTLPADGSATQILGFAQSTLASSGDLVFGGTGRLLGQGALTLSAARVTAESGANQGVEAQGALLRIDTAGAGPADTGRIGQGAALRLAGQRIAQMGRIEAAGGTLDFVASGLAGADSITLGAQSVTSVAGSTVAASPTWTVYGDAGSVSLRADQGSLSVAGLIDASAPGDVASGARGGAIRLRALGGGTGQGAAGVDLAATAQLRAGGASAAQGGQLLLDASRITVAGGASGDLDALAGAIADAGFSDGLDIRLRQGDLRLGSGSLAARQLTLGADAGSLRIDGRVDARTASGGIVRLYAGQDLDFNGEILAGASRAGTNGGDVLLSAGSGSLRLGAAARVEAGGDDVLDGRLLLRAGRSEDSVRLSMAPGFDSARQVQAGELVVEAVQTYRGYTRLGAGLSVGQTLGQDSLLQDVQDFADRSGTLLAGLGLGGDARASLRAGIDIVAAGDFSLGERWNLWQAERPGGQPGLLTVRAAGNLTLAGSLSDGFESADRPAASANTTEPTAIAAGPAWSFRLTAGADLGAANLLAVNSTGQGDLVLAAGTQLRTSAGSIDLAAGRDIVLKAASNGSNQAVVYAAGVPDAAAADALLAASSGSLGWTPQFTHHGGNLSLTAGRDVLGAPSTQLAGAWLYHTGLLDGTPVAWWSNFDSFRMGLGSFGGGQVQVQAGRDVVNLNVVAPSTGLASAPATSDGDVTAAVPPVVSNGGDIRILAGRDILGGSHLLGRGEGLLQAGGQIGAAAVVEAARVGRLAPLLGLMDGHWALRAAGDLAWSAVYNPTVLANAQRISDNDAGFYLTYGNDSSVSATSLAGTVRWQAERDAGSQEMSRYWSGLALNGPQPEQSAYIANATTWAPPVVQALALGGDLLARLPLGLTLAPSAEGELALYASGDLSLSAKSAAAGAAAYTAPLVVSDRTLGLPTVAHPRTADDLKAGELANGSLAVTDTAQWDSIARSNTAPVRLSAGGSMDLAAGGTQVVLYSPKAAEIIAGGDIRGLSLVGQHSQASDVTLIQAGGNVLQGIDNVLRSITLGGPGELQIVAGRQLDLGKSDGVQTVGNQLNANLPTVGASISLAAGQRASLDVDTFVARYLSDNALLADGTARPAVAQRAAIQADGYLRALGLDPTQLDADGQALHSRLVQRLASLLSLTGGDAAGVAQRRSDWVALVRAAQGQASGSAAERLAAYDGTLLAFKALPAAQQVQVAEQLLSGLFAQAYLAEGAPYAATWQAAALAAGVPATQFSGPVFQRVRQQVLFAELSEGGSLAAPLAKSQWDARGQAFALGFAATELAGLGGRQAYPLAGAAFANAYLASGKRYADLWLAAARQAGLSLTATGVPAGGWSGAVFDAVRAQVLAAEAGDALHWASVAPASSLLGVGDLDMASSKVLANAGGDITLLAAGGQINVGLPGTSARPLGVVTYGQGNVNALAGGDFQVNSQRVFVVGQGNITIWSSTGNVDAGRGANTQVSAQKLVPTRQSDGSIAFALPSVTVGSGIGILQPAAGAAAGDIGLFAPNGEVRALDAMIRSPGKITVAAEAVRGADNFKGASSSGVPSTVPPVVAALAAPASNSSEAQGALANAQSSSAATAAARERSSLLFVELLGLGLGAAEETEECARARAAGGAGSAAACEREVGTGGQ